MQRIVLYLAHCMLTLHSIGNLTASALRLARCSLDPNCTGDR